mgnify:CR=1 FL=1
MHRTLLTLSLLLIACGGSEPAPPPAPTTPAATTPAPVVEAAPVDTPVEPIVQPAGKPKVVKPTSAPGIPPLQREPATSSAPASVQGITGLLLARHADDLPAKATLEKHPDAAAALRWIAQNDERLIVAARALEALGYWPDDANRVFLLGVAADTAVPVKSRAAAWRALAAWPASDAALTAAAQKASGDPAVPVARAAQAVTER